MSQFANNWETLDPDPWVRSTIRKGYKIEFSSTPPPGGLFKTTPIPKSKEQRLALEKEISDLLQKRAIYKVEGSRPNLYRSSFFLTPKKPDAWRPIINLKPLNKAFIRPRRFRMETLATVLLSLDRGLWATSIDLKDAYLHIPIHRAYHRFLAFRYKGIDYAFRALPFGLSTAPRVFTRVTKVVLAFLRRKGILVFAYLDDWLLVGRSAQESTDITSYTVSLLEDLGWIVNQEKSSLIPSQILTYLGAVLDLKTGRVCPSPQRVQVLQDTVLSLVSHHRAPARLWLRVLGLMASMVDVVPYCRLFMRPIQIHLLNHFSPSRDPLTKKVSVSPAAKQHLLWWTLPHNVAPGRFIRERRPTSMITTDASLTGWGAVWKFRDAGRRVVPGRLNSPHQCLRVDGHSQSNPDLGCETGEPSGLDPVRQLHNSRLYQPPGRNQVQDSLPEDLGTSPPMPQLQYSHQGLSSSGAGQFHGRRPFQRQPSGNRVVTFTNMGQQSVSHLREAGGGPLRLSSQPQTPTLLHEVLPSRSLGGRRSINPVGQLIPLRLPSVVSDSEGSQQTQPIRNNDPPDSPVLAEPTVVSNTPGDARRPSIQVPSSSGAPVSRQGQNPAPAPQPHTLVSLEIIKQHLAGEGLSQEAASIASQSRRRSTLSTYDSRLAKFREWSSEKNLNPMETSVKDIADFLTSLFNEGKQVATIRNYRSAIASIHKGFPDGSNISSNPAISQLLKGMFNQRPPRRNLFPSWSINDVLSSLSRPPYEPMHNTTLELLTYSRCSLR